MPHIKQHWPLVVALILLMIVFAGFWLATVPRQDGHMIYALDDPYIHMAIAKNVVHHSTWGISPYEFSGASSSPLWTLMLIAIYAVVGVNEITPLILNLLSAVGLLGLLYAMLRREALTQRQVATSLVLLFFLLPIPLLIFIGHEHLLHTLLVLLFLHLGMPLLLREEAPFQTTRFTLWALTPLLSIRYESLFMLAIFCGLLLLRRRWVDAVVIGVLAWVPVVAYAAFSLNHGDLWLPSPIVIKTTLRDTSSVNDTIKELLNQFSYAELRQRYMTMMTRQGLQLAYPALIAVGIYIWRAMQGHTFWEARQVWLLVFIGSAALHVHFARTSYFYRYEAYLVVLFAIILLPPLVRILAAQNISLRAIRANLLQAVVLLAMVAALAFPYILRIYEGISHTPRGMTNIYQQQYQMGRFIKTYYDGQGVVLNDIGAVCYLADIHLLDLWGLGTPATTEAIRKGTLWRKTIGTMAAERDMQIAILYEAEFQYYGGLPQEWVRVALWTIPDRVTPAGKTVTFLAVDPAAADQLRANLHKFEAELPSEVIVDYLVNEEEMSP